MFNRVYGLEIQSIMLVFSTKLCELQYCPSNLISGSPTSPLTPPPFPKSQSQSTVYSIQYITDSVRLGGGGMLSYVGDHILQEFNTLFLTRFRNYKIASSTKTKTLEGRGPQTGKHLPQSPFTGQFF